MPTQIETFLKNFLSSFLLEVKIDKPHSSIVLIHKERDEQDARKVNQPSKDPINRMKPCGGVAAIEKPFNDDEKGNHQKAMVQSRRH